MDRGLLGRGQGSQLTVQRCNACGGFQFGPEWICYNATATTSDGISVSGRGRIYSWVRIWNPVHPALRDACPYIALVVELPDAGNVRMVGNLLGDPRQEPAFDALSKRCSRITTKDTRW